MKEYTEKNGLIVVNEYIDRAMIGTNDKRPALQQMLYDSKNKGFNFALVYKLDKFSRSRYDSSVNRAILLKNGVKLISATQGMIELENKLEDIERQIIVEKSKTNFKLTKEDIVTYLNDALKLEPQLLINYIVNQIILFDDKMQIYFNSPTIKTTNESKTSFSTKIYKLPHIIQNKPQPEMIDILVELYV